MDASHVERSGIRMQIARRLFVLAAAIALGFLLQHDLGQRLTSIAELSKTDMLQARAQLAMLIRVVLGSVFGMTGALGLVIARCCWSWSSVTQFPPGVLARGARRLGTGVRAQRLARVSLYLGIALCTLSLAGFLIAWHVSNVLLACRAGISG